jgi:hypothetical protein
MKIAFGMIVLDGDYVLKQCLEAVYPFAYQILIAEGPVKYWQMQGLTTSTDNTNEIINNFPDPQKKISIIHSQYEDLDDQCNAYLPFLKDDADYLWNLDSDEIFKTEDLETIIKLVEKEKYTKISFQSYSFYGGFKRHITGFEEEYPFIRAHKIYPGSRWYTQMPPTVMHRRDNIILPAKHLDYKFLASEYGIRMYHYSYVFPDQVYKKIQYYKSAIIAKGHSIPDYFEQVYLPWVLGDIQQKKIIENKFQGVHEYIPEDRGPAYTKRFENTHPPSIQNDMASLEEKFQQQLKKYT